MRLGCKVRKILVEGIQGTLFGIRVWPGARVGLGIIVSVGVGTKGTPLWGDRGWHGPSVRRGSGPAVVWRLVLLVVSEMSAHRGQVEPCNSTGDVAKVRKRIFFSDFFGKMAEFRCFPKNSDLFNEQIVLKLQF